MPIKSVHQSERRLNANNSSSTTSFDNYDEPTTALNAFSAFGRRISRIASVGGSRDIPNTNYVPADEPGHGRPIRQLTWDDTNHWKVLTTMHGSVWPRVFPFCIANVVLTYILWFLKHNNVIDLTSDPSGHKYMATMMSFLVVTRVKIIYDNYMKQAKLLSDCYRACRELVHHACVLTARDTSEGAKRWRQDVCYTTIMLLRVTMAVLEFRSSPEQEPWNVPELSEQTQSDLKHHSFLRHSADIDGVPDTTSEAEQGFIGVIPKWLSHARPEERTVYEEAARAPLVLAYNLRKEIMKHRDVQGVIQPNIFLHPCNEELKLIDCVGDYLQAYSGLEMYMTTPLPFPLVQMAKTFLFVWIFSLPFALVHETWHAPYLVLILIFLITYGFVGLEFVAMELSDCFGEDPSDLDDLGHAQICFEDCYIAIYKLDGDKWARSLRRKVMGRLIATQDVFSEIQQVQEAEQQEHPVAASPPPKRTLIV